MLPTFCNARLTLSVLPETGGKFVHLARVNIGVGKEVSRWTFLQIEALLTRVLVTLHLQAVLRARISFSFRVTFVSV
jgi:hypothetical protein